MFVKDMIIELSKLDQDLEVWVDNEGRLKEAMEPYEANNDLYVSYKVVLIR